MHELKIAQNILNIVTDEMAQRKISDPVKAIHFKAGQMHAIIPESLIFNFDAIKIENPVFRNATLIYEIIPLRVQCLNCRQVSELTAPIFKCPNCRNTDLEILNGQEMYVDNIELEEE
jgi:hydrogenase nickel incorporation protein HypA/HybF